MVIHYEMIFNVSLSVTEITLFPSSFYSSFSSTSSDDAPRVHELAHCIQMNHSKAFWAVRNQYAGELRQLWQKGYTGDGFWGRGKTMLSDRYETTGPSHSEYLPSSLCGGTYRTWRGRKRKRGQGITSTSELSYKERQQRRIIKKFGTNGISLGDDEETRVKLEYGKRQKAKPRVANSTRGRELRAAAALARFEGKKEEAMKGDESQPGSDEADSESGDDIGPPPNPAVDCDGAKLVDSEGNQMIRVCENDNNEEDPDVKKETQELQELEQNNSASEVASFEQASIEGSVNASRPQECVSPPQHGFDELINNDAGSSCPICTMHNESDSLYCQACSHVLMPDKTSGSWRCRSENCSGSSFINRADTSRCGVCNVRKED